MFRCLREMIFVDLREAKLVGMVVWGLGLGALAGLFISDKDIRNLVIGVAVFIQLIVSYLSNHEAMRADAPWNPQNWLLRAGASRLAIGGARLLVVNLIYVMPVILTCVSGYCSSGYTLSLHEMVPIVSGCGLAGHILMTPGLFLAADWSRHLAFIVQLSVGALVLINNVKIQLRFPFSGILFLLWLGLVGIAFVALAQRTRIRGQIAGALGAAVLAIVVFRLG